MFGVSKATLQTAGTVVVVLILVAAVQRHVMKVPVVGGYLPS